MANPNIRYGYFDEVPSIINIFFSAMISFTLAVFNIFALSHLFAQLNQAGYGSTKSKIFSIFMFFIGLVPLVAMFCRVMASCYQIFTFNKYRTGCLHYEPNDVNKTLVVHQGINTVILHRFCLDSVCRRAGSRVDTHVN